MVQMKAISKKAWLTAKQSFISHMVQMKDVKKSTIYQYVYLFISHMVQMKEKYYYIYCHLNRLYIPHGSDESYNLLVHRLKVI